MGNRAVITTAEGVSRPEYNIGVYLHWNGGRDSVEAFLAYCKLKGYEPPEVNDYGWARLCQVIGNFFGGRLSLGIDTVSRLDCDNGDNGVYIIKNWEIVDRMYSRALEQKTHDLQEMLLEIDSSQPKAEQLGKNFIMAKEIDPSELSISDSVYLFDIYGNPKKCTVVGFGKEGRVVNGTNVSGKPYVDLYNPSDSDYSGNINNYITDNKVRCSRLH